MYGTWEPVVPMLREQARQKTCKVQSTDAEHGGRSVRSNEEVSVMEMKRRD